MPSRNALPPVWISVLLAAACAGNTAPADFLPSPALAQTEAYGGWIELSFESANSPKPQWIDGELIAVTEDSIWVLSPQGGRAIATRSVKEGKLTAYQAPTGTISGWTALGVVATISNGVVLIITAPLWIITGTVAASHDSHAAVRTMPEHRWQDLAAFARFPQGMPAGVRLTDLKPKS